MTTGLESAKQALDSIITYDDLTDWYEKALRGEYSYLLGEKVIAILSSEIRNEFPSIENTDYDEFKRQRGYDCLSSDFWNIEDVRS